MVFQFPWNNLQRHVRQQKANVHTATANGSTWTKISKPVNSQLSDARFIWSEFNYWHVIQERLPCVHNRLGSTDAQATSSLREAVSILKRTAATARYISYMGRTMRTARTNKTRAHKLSYWSLNVYKQIVKWSIYMRSRDVQYLGAGCVSLF